MVGFIHGNVWKDVSVLLIILVHLFIDAELSSWLACQPHKLDVTGSSPVSAITHLLSKGEIYKRKGVITIVLITKAEKDYLVAHGVRMGSGGISHTISKSKKRTYYLCESEWNIHKLNKYRKNKIVK